MNMKKLIERIEDTLSVYLKSNIKLIDYSKDPKLNIGKVVFKNKKQTDFVFSFETLNEVLIGDRNFDKLMIESLGEKSLK